MANNKIVIIAIFIIIHGLIVYGYHSYFNSVNEKNKIIIEGILKKDSINTCRIEKGEIKLDSLRIVFSKQDSVQSIKINDQKKKIYITKKKYEDNSKDIPFLPEL